MANEINYALVRLPTRAEKPPPSYAAKTFVDVGQLFAVLSSPNHQVMYGRRGTGKTHALRHLQGRISESGRVAIYVDMRTMGSNGSLYNAERLSLGERATALLLDVLESVHADLRTHATHRDTLVDDPELLVPILDAFADSITETRVVGEYEGESTSADTRESQDTNALSIGLSAKDPLSLKAGSERTKTVHTESRQLVRGEIRPTLHLGSMVRPLEELVALLPRNELWILLDEWSSVPSDLQPILADLIRRCLLPVSGVVVKIAAIEDRSRFQTRETSTSYLGFELGADISADLDLDEYMAYTRNRVQAKHFVGNMLLKHLSENVQDRHLVKASPAQLDNRYRVTLDRFLEYAFGYGAFPALVQAAEGIPRDAINIVSMAAQRAGSGTITEAHVKLAARQWYVRDKERSASTHEAAGQLLRALVDEVLVNQRTRGFFLENGRDAEHPLIRYLYDARVIHLLGRDIASDQHPGRRFSLYTLDYGAYVDATGRRVAPPLLLVHNGKTEITIDEPDDRYFSIGPSLVYLESLLP